MQDLAFANSLSKLWPKTSIDPDDLFTSDVMIPIAVVFPAPFGPSKAKKSPCCTSKLTDFSASTPLLYFLDRFFIDRACISNAFCTLMKIKQ